MKGIVRDLESLKKHLHADTIDGAAVQKLVAKLGHETVTLAGKTEGQNAQKVKALGEALTTAASEGAAKA